MSRWNMMNPMCAVCKIPNEVHILQQMNQLLSLLQREGLSNVRRTHTLGFYWNKFYVKCSVGIVCDKVKQNNEKIRRVGTQIDELLEAYIEVGCPNREINNYIRTWFSYLYEQRILPVTIYNQKIRSYLES